MTAEEYIATHPTLSDSDKRYIMAFGVPSSYETTAKGRGSGRETPVLRMGGRQNETVAEQDARLAQDLADEADYEEALAFGEA